MLSTIVLTVLDNQRAELNTDRPTRARSSIATVLRQDNDTRADNRVTYGLEPAAMPGWIRVGAAMQVAGRWVDEDAGRAGKQARQERPSRTLTGMAHLGERIDNACPPLASTITWGPLQSTSTLSQASCMPMPKSITLWITFMTVPMIMRPPGAPRVISGLPPLEDQHRCHARQRPLAAGNRVGAARQRVKENHRIVEQHPVPGTTTPDPHTMLMVWVMATMLRVPVHHREMRRAAAVGFGLPGTIRIGCQRADLGAARVRSILARRSAA